MKLSLLSLSFAALFASPAFAASPATCAYHLDGEAYVGKDDGDLKFNGKRYRCETLRLGKDERTLCRAHGSRSKNYDFYVSFDGAENDFFVFDSLDPESDALCHGVATEK